MNYKQFSVNSQDHPESIYNRRNDTHVHFPSSVDPMNMYLSEKSMSYSGMLLILLHLLSPSNGRPQNHGRAQVNTNFHTGKNHGFQVGKVFTAGGAAEIFLRNLYHDYFYDDGQVKATNSTVSEIIHSVQGNGMMNNCLFLTKNFRLVKPTSQEN